jgi:cytoskeletal protein RodZ
MLRWAEGELSDPEAQSTLEWMLREGDGEKLEHIARDARVPATRVRKRVSRLRKLLRERWAAELTLVGVLLLLGGLGALYWYSLGRTTPDTVEREPPAPLPSAPRALPPSRAAGSAPFPSSVAPSTSSAPSKSIPAPSTTSPTKPSPKASSSSTELTPTPKSPQGTRSKRLLDKQSPFDSSGSEWGGAKK